jgi:phosphoribosylamine--glycine ligase
LHWLELVDDRDGVFLQQFVSRREIGFIALVSDGEIYPLATNQEYKRVYAGNQGILAEAPVGGLVEIDLEDRYGFSRQLLHPLKPWFQHIGYRGPIQVTAALDDEGVWRVLEYNVRLGVTTGPLVAHMLGNTHEVLLAIAKGQRPQPRWRRGMRFGCSVSRVAQGYPYPEAIRTGLPVRVNGEPKGELLWNDVELGRDGCLWTTGPRIADVIAAAPSLEEARDIAFQGIRNIDSPGSFYRNDVCKAGWPPGVE